MAESLLIGLHGSIPLFFSAYFLDWWASELPRQSQVLRNHQVSECSCIRLRYVLLTIFLFGEHTLHGENCVLDSRCLGRHLGRSSNFLSIAEDHSGGPPASALQGVATLPVASNLTPSGAACYARRKSVR